MACSTTDALIADPGAHAAHAARCADCGAALRVLQEGEGLVADTLDRFAEGGDFAAAFAHATRPQLVPPAPRWGRRVQTAAVFLAAAAAVAIVVFPTQRDTSAGAGRPMPAVDCTDREALAEGAEAGALDADMRSCLEAALARDPADRDASWLLTEDAYRADDPGWVDRAQRHARAHASDRPELWTRLALWHHEQRDFGAAAEYAGGVLQLEGDGGLATELHQIRVQAGVGWAEEASGVDRERRLETLHRFAADYVDHLAATRSWDRDRLRVECEVITRGLVDCASLD